MVVCATNLHLHKVVRAAAHRRHVKQHTGASPLAPWHVTAMGLCCRLVLCNMKPSILVLQSAQSQLKSRLTGIGPLAQQPPSPASKSGMRCSSMTTFGVSRPLLDVQATSCLHATKKLWPGSALSFWGSARLTCILRPVRQPDTFDQYAQPATTAAAVGGAHLHCHCPGPVWWPCSQASCQSSQVRCQVHQMPGL